MLIHFKISVWIELNKAQKKDPFKSYKWLSGQNIFKNNDQITKTPTELNFGENFGYTCISKGP